MFCGFYVLSTRCEIKTSHLLFLSSITYENVKLCVMGRALVYPGNDVSVLGNNLDLINLKNMIMAGLKD